MESKPGSILSLISGIINFVCAFGVLIMTLILSFLPEIRRLEGSIWIFVLMLVVFIWLVAMGILQIWAYSLMKVSKTTTKGGIIALITGFFSVFGILALIGGIFGIIHGEQKR